MGLLDNLNKIVEKVDKVSHTADRSVNSVKRAQRAASGVGQMAGSAAKFLAKKCKYCKAELKTDAEKKKEICANCALERM